MRDVIVLFLRPVSRWIHEMDASFASGSISNAREGVRENRRRRELQRAADHEIARDSRRRVAV